jgi:hypothetical protein
MFRITLYWDILFFFFWQYWDLNPLPALLFAFWVTFWVGFLFGASFSPWSSYLCLLSSWGHRLVPLCIACWKGVLLTFCLGWPWTTVFLISAFQVAVVRSWLIFFFFGGGSNIVGLGLRDLCLLGRHFISLKSYPSPFLLQLFFR